MLRKITGEVGSKSLPEEIEDINCCEIQTHPFGMVILLLHCSIRHDFFQSGHNSMRSPEVPSFTEEIDYTSDNAGKGFKRIDIPVNE